MPLNTLIQIISKSWPRASKLIEYRHFPVDFRTKIWDAPKHPIKMYKSATVRRREYCPDQQEILLSFDVAKTESEASFKVGRQAGIADRGDVLVAGKVFGIDVVAKPVQQLVAESQVHFEEA